MGGLLQEWEKLKKVIEHHDNLYFNEGAPVISDEVYDILKRRLLWLSHKLKIEAEKVGHTPLSSLPEIRHDKKMLSIDSDVGEEGLKRFLMRLEAKHSIYPIAVQHKIDGLAVSMKYVGGSLLYAATRGNGSVGEDVTLKTRFLVPREIATKEEVCVRGEVYIPTRIFAEVEHNFSSSRNAASGILRKIHSRQEEVKMLRFLAYELVPDERYKRYEEILKVLKSWGFEVLGTQICDSQASCLEVYEKLDRSKLDYAVDGLVYKVDDLSLSRRLGYTARAPRSAFACKFPAREGITRVERLVFQVGRRGVITPVLKVQSIHLSEAKISSATLHNAKNLREKDVRIGDQVVISRAGDVIPYMKRILYEMRTGEEPRAPMPDTCPSCGEKLVVEEIDIKCPAGWSCPEQVIAKLQHFTSCMEIENISLAHLKRFYELGLVRCVEDLYCLEREKIVSLRGWGERSWVKLQYHLSKPVPLENVIFALGIDGVGRVVAQALAKRFGPWQNFISGKEFSSIEGIGERTEENIKRFLQKEKGMIEAITRHVKILEAAPEERSYTGEKWVITGSFSVARKELMRKAETLGVEVVSAVSKKVTRLLCGEDPGSKLDEARRLGIRVMKEKEVEEMLEGLVGLQSGLKNPCGKD